MNKILVCLSIFFLGTALVAQTILSRGDLAILGVNSTITPSTQDEISFVCFQDIKKGTEIQLTDNGYEACTKGTWSSAEGGAKLTRTGATIPAGTVITMRDAYTSGSSIQFTYPDADWATTDLVPGVVTQAYVNLNSKGDQLYFAQNGTWTNIPNSLCTVSSTASGSTTSANADYPGVNGRILFGFSTSGGWNSLQNSTGESGLYPSTDCFTMALSSASKYNKYTGLQTAATQTEWLTRISNQNNWSGYITSNGYFAAKPDFHFMRLNINPLGIVSNPSWASPKNLICAADNSIDLNSLVTGTQGGSWSGVGTSSNGIFNPAGLSGTYGITYSVNYNSGMNNCQLSQTDTIQIASNTTPTFNPITVLQGSTVPELPTSSTNSPPILGTWDTPINTNIKGITNYTFTPNNTRCNNKTIFGVDVIDSALSPLSICVNYPISITGADDAVAIHWYKKGVVAPVKTALQIPATKGITVAGTGGKGSGSNQLGAPMGVAVDSKGNVYVCDSANKQVSKWAPGANSCTIAAGGNGWGYNLNQFKQPFAIFIDDKDTLYVSDYNASRVLKFPPGSTSSTNGVVVAGGNNSGKGLNQLNDPTGVYVDAARNVYVSDAANNRVVKWAQGATTGTVVIQGPFLWFPSGVCGAGPDSLYVTDANPIFGGGGIYKYPIKGTSASNYSKGVSLGTGFSQPASPFLDPKGNLYLSDHGSNNVLKYQNKSFVTVAGGKTGSAANQLNLPSGLWVVNGTIYVGDYNNFRVQKWAPSIDTTFTPNTAGNYFAVITRYSGALDTTNTILVSDSSSSITNASICPAGSYFFNGTTYTKAGKYTAKLTNSGGCDSLAILNLTVKDTTSSVTKASICKSSSYTFNGTVYNSAGTYNANLKNSVGCDSIATLILSVKDTATSTTNASICAGKSYTFNGIVYNKAGAYSSNFNLAGSCDSVAYLVLTLKDTSSSITRMSICKGTSYTFNGTAYTNAGTYSANLTNAAGCDSIAYLELSLKDTTHSITKVSICKGTSFTFNGTTYNNAGTYAKQHLVNSAGCDSTAYLVLSLKDTSFSITKASICKGDSYSFNGSIYSAVGTYGFHFTNAVGCDSVAYLELSLNDTTSSVIKESICPKSSFSFNGKSYTTPGTYYIHLINAAGCDSTVVLLLSYKDTTSSVTHASICKGSTYTFNGATYSQAGIYRAKLVNSVGCDSTAVLVLSANDTSSSVSKASFCKGGSYAFNGSIYTQPGTYSVHITKSNGCDSIAVLVLTQINPTPSVTKVSICKGGSYTFNGTNYTKAGIDTVHLTQSTGCDSIAVLVLTLKDTTSSISKASICKGSSYSFNGSSYSQAGTYTSHLTNSVGCDSSAILVLTLLDTTSSITTARICLGSTYTFNGTTYNTAGTYTAHLVNSVGCDSTAELLLIVDDPNAYPPSGPSAVCKGACIQLTNITPGGKWSSLSPSIATIDSISGVLTGINTGTAMIHYALNKSCGLLIDTATITVLGVKPTLVLNSPRPATCINPESGSFSVTITGKESPYQFSYDGNKYNSASFVTNLGVGTYAVGIYNSSDCLVDSFYNIKISMSTDASCDTFYVPTGFMPSSTLVSGHNNLLKPFGGGNSIQSLVFRVFNRSGYLVFETHSLNDGWDGTVNGTPQNAGTYIWSLEYTKDGKRKYAKGTSVLLR